ncbi:VanW family protein [Paraclostridium ghonii]|uniref:Vancomycin resistance protein YoaR n=1 Tax=Paraclostridium ghonii TaxID=29358 RepID=A0ABU0N3E9_9FIRM|nr:VanW family protein [Paeniclostridium ghonii]MDQ0557655.1 vancomycin resistance protein YoaR [Paeniclostridium ghonii]
MTFKYQYLIVVIFVSSLLLGVGINKTEIDNSSTIYKNIYIEDTNVSLLTFNEALNLVQSIYKEKPIKLIYENKTYIINPEDINLKFNIEKAVKEAYFFTRNDDIINNFKRKSSLRLKNKYHIKLVSTYDEVKLSKIINDICKEIDISEVNATINIDDKGSIKRTKSKNGEKVDKIKLKESIYNLIINKKINNLKIPVNIVKPKVTTENVNSINTVLGQFSTTFNYTTSRGNNINVAANSTSNKLIMPHKEFSYNNSTGARTWHNGYKTAKIIAGGKYVNGEGGGVCQVSTTIYNAALISGMNISEVHNHTFVSRYAPAGRDAAVSYGYTDFKFENPLMHPVYIKNTVNKGIITSKIYGCDKDRERLYIITKSDYDQDKIKVDTYRIYLDEEGNIIREELVNKNTYNKK